MGISDLFHYLDLPTLSKLENRSSTSPSKITASRSTGFCGTMHHSPLFSCESQQIILAKVKHRNKKSGIRFGTPRETD